MNILDHVYIIKYLKLQCIHSILKSDEPLELLKLAVKARNKYLVRELLKKKPQLNCETGGLILWDAVLKGEVKIASMLVEAGADVNVRRRPPYSFWSSSILHQCVQNDSKYDKLALLIMKHGADVNVRGHAGNKLLYHALLNQASIDVIREIVRHGGRVEYWQYFDVATRYSNAVEIMSLILCDFLDNETKRKQIDCALFSTAIESVPDYMFVPVVKLILSMKLPVEEMQLAKWTFLLAIYTRKIEMVKLLLEYGFEVNEETDNDLLPRLVDSEVKSYMSSNYSYIRGKEYPIHAACLIQSVEIIQLLLRYGADIQVTNSQGRTPFSRMNFEGSVNGAHRMIIKHFAVLINKRQRINDCDMTRIESHPEMHVYYMQCMNELTKMKLTNYSSFSTLQRNVRQLSFVMRNCEFVKNFNRVQREEEFPIYCEEIDFAFDNAKRRLNLMSEKDEAVCETLNNILPLIPLEQIMYYFYMDETE